MIAKLIDSLMEFIFGFPVPPTPGLKHTPPARKEAVVSPYVPEKKREEKSSWKDRNKPKDEVIPPGVALGEDMPLDELKAYHKNQNRYTRDDLLDRAIEFRLLTGQWPTKAGSAGGSWHERWAEAANHVGLPAPKTYYKRFGSLSNAWQAANEKLLAPKKESCEDR